MNVISFMAFREHFKKKLNIQVAILKVTFSCDSLPKTHFVDIQVGKNHIKSVVT